MTLAAPSASSARVRPPGPGPTSITVTPSSGPAARAIRPVRLRSSRKFWPSDLRAMRPWRRIDFAQRRQRVDHLAGAIASGADEARRELERGDEARRARAAGAGDVERGAVIRRGAHERQAERHIDRMIERERLDRDQRLIVIHRERGVVAAPRGGVEHGVGRQRPARQNALRGATARRRARPRLRSSSPSAPSSPACGFKSGERKPRLARCRIDRAGRARRSGRSRRSGRG